MSNDELSNDLEHAVENSLDIIGSIPTSPMNTIPKRPAHAGSSLPVATQMLGLAETIKSIHQDIDALQAEIIERLNDLRKRLGSKA